MTFDEAYRILRAASRYSFASVPIIRITEAIRLIKRIEETYAKPVEMTQEQRGLILAMKKIEHETLIDGWDVWFNNSLKDIEPDDALRAWLHPELIKVVD